MDEDNASVEQHGRSHSLISGDATKRRYLELLELLADGRASARDIEELAEIEAGIPADPLPARLRRKVLSSGIEACGKTPARQGGEGSAGPTGLHRARGRSRLGFGLVVTVVAVFAVAGLWSSPDRPGFGEHFIDRLSAGAGRARLLNASAQTFRWPCSTEQGEVIGDVVWDNRRQAGYLRLEGVRPNDPLRKQYQLWIYDADRDERYPVTGGTFDMPAGVGEIVVPFHPELRVDRPLAFAVTEEPAGGVVVSSGGRVIAVARATTD